MSPGLTAICVCAGFWTFKSPTVTFYFAVCLGRYRTLVRAVRLGYNVLMTDNDVIMFDDPYAYFKAPPFSHFTVLNQQEWPDTHEPNGGFIYVQNARPNGPAVWLFTEVCASL